MNNLISYSKKLDILEKVLTNKQAKDVISKARENLAFTIGNSKIGKDTLIINLGSASYCPSARLGLCNLAPKRFGGSGQCYALKAERMYPSSKAFRAVQFFQWQAFSALEISDKIFSEVLRTSRLKNKSKRIKFIRLNESGDFHSSEQVKKVDMVLRYVNEYCEIYDIPKVKLYTYTHRSDLFQGETGKSLLQSLSPYFTITGSGFMVHNSFTVKPITRAERDNRVNGAKVNKYTCLDDCTRCSLCKTRTGIDIIQAIH
jgi:hypothetical protein